MSKDMVDGKKLARYFFRTLIICSVIGFSISALLYLGELYENGIDKICLSSRCYNNFIERFSSSFSVLKYTVKFVVALATIGGIYIAIKSYVNSSYTSAISNHIGNFRVFKDFVENEVLKYGMISLGSVNTIFWYNSLFPKSRTGVLEVSEQYENIINSINEVIVGSNRLVTTSEKPDFSYLVHQDNMKLALAGVGIKIDRLPRNQFYQVEGQVLDLIRVVNLEFCMLDPNLYAFSERKYI